MSNKMLFPLEKTIRPHIFCLKSVSIVWVSFLRRRRSNDSCLNAIIPRLALFFFLFQACCHFQAPHSSLQYRQILWYYLSLYTTPHSISIARNKCTCFCIFALRLMIAHKQHKFSPYLLTSTSAEHNWSWCSHQAQSELAAASGHHAADSTVIISQLKKH